MKRVTIILTFIVVSIISTGSFFMYELLLSSHRSDVRAYIHDNKKSVNYSVLSINPSELYLNTKTITWEDDNKEIIYNGEQYDIISIRSENGKLAITLLSDKQEDSIKLQFASNYIESTANTNNPIKLLKQILSLKFIYNSPINFSIDSGNFYCGQYIYTAYTPKVFLSLDTPPPIQHS